MNENIKIFAGRSSRNLAEKICAYLDIQLGNSQSLKFTEGNIFVKINETVRKKDIYLVQSVGLCPNDEFMEILFWIDAFKKSDVNSITLIMPYFSYAKGDKKDDMRVSIRAKVCAECIELMGADRIITIDLHSPQVEGFFKKPTENLTIQPIMCEYIKQINFDNFKVASPDAGSIKRSRIYAKDLNTEIVIGDKIRRAHNDNAEILEIIGDVNGKNILIVDDFTVSGGTVIELAKAMKIRGAKKLYVCLSHLLLNSMAVKKIMDSPIDLVISTDSVNNINIIDNKKFKILSVAPLLAECINRINNGLSLGPLFEFSNCNLFEKSLLL